MNGDADHINGMDHDGTLFWRADFREAPHNSYTSYKNVKQAADDKGYAIETRTEPLTFKASPDKPSDALYSIRLDYGTKSVTNRVEYGYDKKVEGYVRKSDGVLTTDLETEEPVVLQNILIAEAEHHMKDAYGRRDIDLRSGGKGLLLQNGKSIGSAGRTKTAGSYRRLTAKPFRSCREKRGSISFPISARFLLAKEKVCKDADR